MLYTTTFREWCDGEAIPKPIRITPHRRAFIFDWECALGIPYLNLGLVVSSCLAWETLICSQMSMLRLRNWRCARWRYACARFWAVWRWQGNAPWTVLWKALSFRQRASTKVCLLLNGHFPEMHLTINKVGMPVSFSPVIGWCAPWCHWWSFTKGREKEWGMIFQGGWSLSHVLFLGYACFYTKTR
jgi:hypothetical protein